MTELNSLVAQLKSVANDLKGQIHELDERIQDAEQRRNLITQETVSKADFMIFLRADIRAKGKPFWGSLRPMIKNAPRQYPMLERGLTLPYLTGNEFAPVVMTEEAAFFYLGDLIADRIERAISEDMEWPHGVMPVSERRKLVAQIDAEILDLKEQRQELAAQLLEAGLAG